MSVFVRASQRLALWLRLIALVCFRHPLVVLGAIALLTGVATVAMSRLSVNPDIAQLLPDSFASVRDLRALRDRFGGVGYVVVVADDADPEALRRFADDIAPRLEALPTVRYVDYRRPVEFFADRGLYFLDKQDLVTVRDRLTERQTWEINRQALDLDDEAPPPVDFSDIETKYKSLFAGQAGGRDGDAEPYYLDAAKRRIAVLVKPRKLASDFGFVKEVVSQVEGVVTTTDLSKYGPSIKVQLTGRYKKRVDLQGLITRDLTVTSVVSTVLILLYVALHFRKLTATILVILPLYVGLSFCYGLAAFWFGTLNILTAFIGAMLVGIGIDHGVHLLGRYEEARRDGVASEEAVQNAFGDTGRIALAAALSTASAFACLTISEFRAFREFGLIAGVGIMLLLFTYLAMLPALLGLISRFAKRLDKSPPGLRLPLVRPMLRWAPVVFWACLGVTLVALATLPKSRFNYDFAALDSSNLPSDRLDGEVNQLLGRSQTPLVLLGENAGEGRLIAEAVRERQKSLGAEATVDRVVTLTDVVPDDQDAKRDVIDDIRRVTSRIHDKGLDEGQRDKLARLRYMARALPFSAADLPESVRRQFEGEGGAFAGGFVLAYPSISLSDGAATRRLAAQMRATKTPDGKRVPAAGEAMVLADVLDTVFRDAPRIFVATLVLVFFTLWTTVGRLHLALLSLLPAAVTIGVTAGLMPLVGIEFNYLNMILVPILLGIGVDDGAHIVNRLDEGDALEHVIQYTGWDIFGAILTDVFGFGVMVFARHSGLRSLGQLALLGLTVNMAACVVFLPALLALWPVRPSSPRAAGGAGTPAFGGRGVALTVATVGKLSFAPRRPTLFVLLAALPTAYALRSLTPGSRVAILITLVALGTWAANAVRARQSDVAPLLVDVFLGTVVALALVPWIPIVVAVTCAVMGGVFALLAVVRLPFSSGAPAVLRGALVGAAFGAMILMTSRVFLRVGINEIERRMARRRTRSLARTSYRRESQGSGPVGLGDISSVRFATPSSPNGRLPIRHEQRLPSRTPL